MTAALGTLLREWAIPMMNVRRMHVSAFAGNKGSVRVFEKNGFKHVDTVDECIDLADCGRHGKVGLHVLDWKIEDQPSIVA